MQTSSNFFNKNLFSFQDDPQKHKKIDKYHHSHIVSDPLHSKEDLTPWTEINPKYNFNTERLIKFKQKIVQQGNIQPAQEQAKQSKSDMISNLFNFYKNNKEKKRSTLNNAKRKSKLNDMQLDDQNKDNSWSLPPIIDDNELQMDLLDDEAKINAKQQKINQSKQKLKKKSNFIQSINIRDYLSKLKQKQKVIALATIEKSNQKESLKTLQMEEFTSNRYVRKQSKGNFFNSMSLSKQLGHAQIDYRYVPIRNPQNANSKKRKSNISPLQSLQHSFEIYKKAAEQEVHQNNGQKKSVDRKFQKLNVNFSLGQKNLFKNNVPLSSLFSPSEINRHKQRSKEQKSQNFKKYNTISYDRSFSPSENQGQNSLILPKVSKNYSYHK